MNATKFIELASSLGYAIKPKVKAWVKKQGRDTFSEEDFIELFRYYENMREHEMGRLGHTYDYGYNESEEDPS